MYRMIALAFFLVPQIIHRAPEPARLSVPFRQTNAFDCQTGQTLLPLPLDADDRRKVLAQLRQVCEDRK